MVRYDNTPAKVCRIIFSVICFALSAFLIYALVSYFVALRGGEDLVVIGVLLIGMFTCIATAIIAIPFILLMVLCRKPLLPIISFSLLVLLAVSCFVFPMILG